MLDLIWNKDFIEGYKKGFEDAKNMYMHDLAELYQTMKESKPLKSVTTTTDGKHFES